MTLRHSDTTLEFLNIILEGVNLPLHVFAKRFDNYLFFDNDICTSDDLIFATQSIIRESFKFDSTAFVYSCLASNYLGCLHATDDWVLKVNGFSKKMNESGDYGGLIIVDHDKKWALFQKTPVEEGVLGIDNGSGVNNISELIYDNFIDCGIIASWLHGDTKKDKELVNDIGRDYLVSLLDNYSIPSSNGSGTCC